MSSRVDYDIAIIGAGLAGLSLAVRLAELSAPRLRILLIDSRKHYVRDRTWSYWSGVIQHPFQAAVSKHWDAWAIATNEGVVKRSVPGVRYESLCADAVYELAFNRLHEADNIDIRLGTRIVELEEEGDRITLRLPEQVQVRQVFDSRVPTELGQHGLIQRFLGQEIETEQPVFDPNTALLMDFRVSQQATHFVYVLPLSAQRALVEDTYFAPPGFCPPDHRATLTAYLAERYGISGTHKTRLLFEEQGALPMDPCFHPLQRSPHIYPLGSAAGALRPATGYGFIAIQMQCERIAQDLKLGRPPRAITKRSGLIRWMDRTFLACLSRLPYCSPAIFRALFAHCPPSVLIRFLNDQARFTDCARVATALLPSLPQMWRTRRNFMTSE